MDEQHQTVYAALGEDTFIALVAAFYRRVSQDPLLRPLYPEEDLAPAERRLRLFLVQYFCGPETYSSERGHPRLRMRHMPYEIGKAQRDSWVAAMVAAMDEVGVPQPAYDHMRQYFEGGATFLVNHFPGQPE
jgi:hemoglobin